MKITIEVKNHIPWNLRLKSKLGILLQPGLVHKYHYNNITWRLPSKIAISKSNDDYDKIPLYLKLGHHIPLYQLGFWLPLDNLGP